MIYSENEIENAKISAVMNEYRKTENWKALALYLESILEEGSDTVIEPLIQKKLGELYLEMDKPEKARTYIEKAIQQDDYDFGDIFEADTGLLLMDSYFHSGMKKEFYLTGIDTFIKALESPDVSPQTTFEIGFVLSFGLQNFGYSAEAIEYGLRTIFFASEYDVGEDDNHLAELVRTHGIVGLSFFHLKNDRTKPSLIVMKHLEELEAKDDLFDEDDSITAVMLFALVKEYELDEQYKNAANLIMKIMNNHFLGLVSADLFHFRDEIKDEKMIIQRHKMKIGWELIDNLKKTEDNEFIKKFYKKNYYLILNKCDPVIWMEIEKLAESNK